MGVSLPAAVLSALPGSDPERLAAALDAALDAARAAWPDVTLQPELFFSALAERSRRGAGPGDDPLAALAALHAGDVYLAIACSRGVPAALGAFEKRYIAEVPAFLSGLTDGAALSDEVAQKLRERLLVGDGQRPPQIAGYSGRGTLASWLRVAALRTASNLRRDEKAEPGSASPRDAPETITSADPELSFLKERYRGAFEEALRDAFAALDPEERTLLRMRFLDGLNIDRLSAFFQIHRATAARRLAGARERLLAATMELLRGRLGVRGPELDSLLGLVRSQLQLSLRTLLREP